MSDRAQQFRTRRDVESRERFDMTCGIALATFGSLIGPYVFHESEQVKCQLEKDGNVCGQVHWHGWVARRSDGAEGYIGRDCAAANFGADRTFASERSRVNRELRIDALLERLAGFLADPAFPSRLDEAVERHRAMRTEIGRVRDAWPEPVMSRLQGMGKTGNRNLVAEFQHIEVDEKKRTIRTWVPSVIGAIGGVDVFDPTKLREVGQQLSDAKKALSAATASRDLPERTLRQWTDAFGDVERCEAVLDEYQGALDAFLKPENLRGLCWAASNERIQEAAISAMVELTTGKRPADGVAYKTGRSGQRS